MVKAAAGWAHCVSITGMKRSAIAILIVCPPCSCLVKKLLS